MLCINKRLYWASRARARATARVTNESYHTYRCQRGRSRHRGTAPSFPIDPLGTEENGLLGADKRPGS